MHIHVYHVFKLLFDLTEERIICCVTVSRNKLNVLFGHE